VAIDIQKVESERDLLGEGALWDPRDEFLYWIDSNGCRIRRLDPRSGEVRNWPVEVFER
jgi:sugar lactone lactonase YvrE